MPCARQTPSIQAIAARAWPAACLVGLCLVAGFGGLAKAASLERPLPESEYAVKPLCAPPGRGRATCLGLRLVAVGAAARSHTTPLGLAYRTAATARRAGAAARNYGLTPQDLHTAYNLPTATLASPGQTIGIVDAYSNPSLEADLATYDQEFGLPPCTAANGCLRIVNEAGQSGPLPQPNTGWGTEIALDVEIAHAICEDCHILLVETESEGGAQLEAGVRTARALGATVISLSWGMEEPASAAAAETFNLPGVAVVAAAGDYGYRNWYLRNPSEEFVFYPAASPDVLAVGGTRLEVGPEGRYLQEQVWNGQGATGGGCAERPFFEAPTWQKELPDWSEVGCQLRAVADLSADGDPYTGVAIYNAAGEGRGWETIGGTSLATPLIAGAIALAGGVAEGTSYIAQTIYANARSDPAAFHQVREGSNGSCEKPYTASGLSGCTALEEGRSCNERAICLAHPPYSGPAGLGSPDGLAAFTAKTATAPTETGSATTTQTTATSTTATTATPTTTTVTTTASSATAQPPLERRAGTETGKQPAVTPSPPRKRKAEPVRIVSVRLTGRRGARLSRRGRLAVQRRAAVQVVLSGPAQVDLRLLERRGRRWRRLWPVAAATSARRPYTLTVALAALVRGPVRAGRYRLLVALADGQRRRVDFWLG